MSRSSFDYLKIKQILDLIKKKKLTLTEIMFSTGWSYATVRRYIKFMEKEGMITTKPIKVGNRIVKVIVQAKG